MGRLAFVLYIANLLAAISILFIRKKEVGSTIAWLLILAFVPWLGFLLYFFFGSTQKFKILSRKYQPNTRATQYSISPTENGEALISDKFNLSGQGRESCRDMILMNLRGSGAVYTQNNAVRLLNSAKEKYDLMFEEIANAHQTVNVLYFIFKTKDESGKKLISLLARKAREGVKIRLVYDTLGCLKTRRADFQELIDAGGLVYGYLPSFFRTVLQVNYRMHRKMVIIDGEIAYTGGINIGDDYLGQDKRIKPWRDTSIRLTGSCVNQIQLQFIRDWVTIDAQARHPYNDKIDSDRNLHTYMKQPRETGGAGVQIVSSGPDCLYPYTKDAYVRMVTQAKNYLYIQTPYFVPDETILSSLRCAALAGVDVRVMIPGVPDKSYAYHVTISHMGDLLRSGIKVFVYPGFLHSKTFVSDDLISNVGTTNVDIRSFDLDFEINAVIYDREFAQTCRHSFEQDQIQSIEMTVESYKKRPFFDKIQEGLLRLVAPLL